MSDFGGVGKLRPSARKVTADRIILLFRFSLKELGTKSYLVGSNLKPNGHKILAPNNNEFDATVG